MFTFPQPYRYHFRCHQNDGKFVIVVKKKLKIALGHQEQTQDLLQRRTIFLSLHIQLLFLEYTKFSSTKTYRLIFVINNNRIKVHSKLNYYLSFGIKQFSCHLSARSATRRKAGGNSQLLDRKCIKIRIFCILSVRHQY